MSTDADPENKLPDVPVRESDRLIRLFEPLLQNLEQSTQNAAASQLQLRQELDQSLESLKQLKALTDNDVMVTVMEEKSKKLLNLRRRLTLVHTILQTCNERTKKMCAKN